MPSPLRAGGPAALLLVLLSLFLGGMGHDALHHEEGEGSDCTLCLVSGGEPEEGPCLAEAAWVVAPRVEGAPLVPRLAEVWSDDLGRGPPVKRAGGPASRG